MTWATGIRNLLTAAATDPSSPLKSVAIAEATSSPWAWPVEAELANALVAAGARRPEHRVGDVLLSACQRARKGSLWWLSTRPDVDRAAVAMLPTAAKAWDDAAAAVERTLPVLVHPAPALVDARVSRTFGDAQTTPIDGASYGLSMALAIASVRLGLPAPLSLAASATVDRDGTLGPVDGLTAKLAAIERDADPVTTFVVAASQAEALREIASRVRVVGCEHLADVIELAWPDLTERTIDQIDDLPAAARRLLHLVLEGHYTTKTWRPVARCAVMLADRVDATDETTRGLLHYAASFSFRHAGAHPEARVWLDRVDRDAVDRAVAPAWRRSIAAQLVQHAADTAASDDEQRAVLAAAGPPLMQAQLHHLEIEERKQLGAIGRLRHALGDYAEAAVASERAARAWIEAGDGRAHEASFPLSQWFVSAGAGRDGGAYERACWFADDPACADGLDATGRPFVALGRGRAALQLEAHGDARRWLTAARDGGGPDHVRLSALRWLARLGHPDGRAARDALLTEAEAPTASTSALFVALHQLDAALGLVPGVEGSDAAVVNALAVLCANPTATWAVRVRERGGSARDVAEGFPY